MDGGENVGLKKGKLLESYSKTDSCDECGDYVG